MWFYRGLVLLVIACPCALVISTPVSIVSGLASAARNGVLIKGGAYLEAMGHLRGMALDKTGTLTYGRPSVQEVIPFGEHSPEELLAIAAGLEAESEHPLAGAVLERAEADGISPLESSDHRALQGKGAEARIEGRPFWIGSHRLMDEKGQETAEVHDAAVRLEDAGHSVIAIGNDRHVCGLISVGDGVRDGVAQALQALRHLGVRRIEMLTGDNEGTARAVAGASGVDAYESELLPEGKVQAVEAMVRNLKHVAMVGDGVNDAPAMAVASIGVAMGAVGTDVAIETADVALMSDELDRLPWAIRHSRRALRTIKQNIVFALAVKFAFVGLAVVGAATLWMAIAADMGTSLLVIFNSLRLLHPGRR
jgi:Cd2+/Zn2+-exporting ATPase